MNTFGILLMGLASGFSLGFSLCTILFTQVRKNREDLIMRLRKRAEIRRQIPGRKSVQNGEPDRIADLLEEAADALEGK